MEQQIIQTDGAPAAIGPYVQGRKVGPFLYTSGQIGWTPDGQPVGDNIELQTKQVLANLAAILKAGGGDTSHVVKTMVFVKNMNDFDKINKIYAAFFGDHKPARSLVEAARLPKDVLIEIECIAYIP